MEQQTTRQAVRNAIKEVKAFEWEGDYRPAAREAIKEMLEGQMAHWADRYLAEMEAQERSRGAKTGGAGGAGGAGHHPGG